MVTKREYKFTMMLSDDEKLLLEELSDLDGTTASNYLRTLLRREDRMTLKPQPRKALK